jgi:hypothetical protein
LLFERDSGKKTKIRKLSLLDGSPQYGFKSIGIVIIFKNAFECIEINNDGISRIVHEILVDINLKPALILAT